MSRLPRALRGLEGDRSGRILEGQLAVAGGVVDQAADLRTLFVEDPRSLDGESRADVEADLVSAARVEDVEAPELAARLGDGADAEDEAAGAVEYVEPPPGALIEHVDDRLAVAVVDEERRPPAPAPPRPHF